MKQTPDTSYELRQQERSDAYLPELKWFTYSTNPPFCFPPFIYIYWLTYET